MFSTKIKTTQSLVEYRDKNILKGKILKKWGNHLEGKRVY